MSDRSGKKHDYVRICVQICIHTDPDQKTLEVFRSNGTRHGPLEILRDNDIWKPTELAALELHLEKLWM